MSEFIAIFPLCYKIPWTIAWNQLTKFLTVHQTKHLSFFGREYNLFHCTCIFATKSVGFQGCIESSLINSKRTDWIYLLRYSELKRLFRKLLSSSIFCLCATTSCIIEDLGPLFQCKIVHVASTRILNKNYELRIQISSSNGWFSESPFIIRYFNLRSHQSWRSTSTFGALAMNVACLLSRCSPKEVLQVWLTWVLNVNFKRSCIK